MPSLPCHTAQLWDLVGIVTVPSGSLPPACCVGVGRGCSGEPPGDDLTLIKGFRRVSFLPGHHPSQGCTPPAVGVACKGHQAHPLPVPLHLPCTQGCAGAIRALLGETQPGAGHWVRAAAAAANLFRGFVSVSSGAAACGEGRGRVKRGWGGAVHSLFCA